MCERTFLAVGFFFPLLFMHVDNHGIVQLSICFNLSWRSICYFWLLLLCVWFGCWYWLSSSGFFLSPFAIVRRVSVAYLCMAIWLQYRNKWVTPNRQKQIDISMRYACRIQTFYCWFICDNSQLMTIINKTFRIRKGVCFGIGEK